MDRRRAVPFCRGGTFAQNWQALNNDWDYYLEYDGQDIAQGWTQDPQTNQIISLYQETDWPETVQAPQGIHNYSDNPFLTTYWYSEGTITLHLRWRHLASNRPETVGLVVESPANAQAVGTSPVIVCDGGIGIEAWYQGNGLVTAGKRLRIVKIGGNGEGEFEVEKTATASATGVGATAYAEATGFDFDQDGRNVIIIDQFGAGWPKSPSEQPQSSRPLFASQDLFPWFEPIDPTSSYRTQIYTPIVPVPAARIHSSFVTDYSAWHVAMPQLAQKRTIQDGAQTLEPPLIPQVQSAFTGRILDVRPGEQWTWSGYGGFDSGTVSNQELQIHPSYQRSHDGGLTIKTIHKSSDGTIQSETMSLDAREGRGAWSLILTHS